MAIKDSFSSRATRLKPAAIRNVLSRIPEGSINFTAGKPAPHLFPLQVVYEQTANVLEKYGGESMQYAATFGFPPLRSWIAEQTPPANQDNVLIVGGSQQAIDMTGRLLIDPGDKVAMSAPTYTAAISTLQVYGADFISVECDKFGLLPDSLEKALKQKPKLLYVIANFLNPTGVDVTLERRQMIVEMAQHYDVPILEDDPYGALRFEGVPLPNLFELAPEQVIYAGTFSKVIAPGFRIGWMVAADEVIGKLMLAKQTADLQVGTYVQKLAYEMVASGFFGDQIEQVRNYYQRQCDVMLAAIAEHFPSEVTVFRPAGGMFVWCELPDRFDTEKILEEAFESRVAYVPGRAFYPNGEKSNGLRLSFSMATEAEIEPGIARLGQLFRQVLARNQNNS